MRFSRSSSVIGSFILLAMSFLLSGCIILSGERSSRGTNLSEAMESSAQGGGEPLSGSGSGSYSDVGVAADEDTTTSIIAGGDVTTVQYDKRDYVWQLPVDVAYSMPFSGDIRALTHFTISPLSFESEENLLEVYVGGATVAYVSGSLPDRATKSPWMFESGLTFRHYLNHSRTALSPYIAARVGYELLNWTYRNAIVADGDTIRGDSLDGVEGYVGFGVSTRRDYRLSAFGEAGVGGTAFACTSWQGFDNDVFASFGYVSIKVGMSLKF
jgi:hypothetical protein